MIWRLGARVLFELLDELDRNRRLGEDLDARLSKYAAADLDLLRAVGADRFPHPPLSLVSEAGDDGRRRCPRRTRLRKWAPHRKGAMLRWAEVELSSEMIGNKLRLLLGKNGNGCWVAMPSVKRLDGGGNPVCNANGKPIYDPIIEFRDRATSQRFSSETTELVQAAHPGDIKDTP